MYQKTARFFVELFRPPSFLGTLAGNGFFGTYTGNDLLDLVRFESTCKPLPVMASNNIGIPIDAKIVPHPAPICFLVGLMWTPEAVCKALRISCFCLAVRYSLY